jgi:N-acylneuraminate cytidylyltransferase
MKIEGVLFIIPARGGSKGLPRKNILPLAGKPMICYTIDAARGMTSDENICISTDDAEIIQIVEDYGLKVHFVRPAELAIDTAGSREVILHATNFYLHNFDKTYSTICLLQPTSPLRTAQHISEAFKLWNDDLDMVVSVKEAKTNPYFNLFEEDKNGLLKKSKGGNFTRRQDAPKVWEFNGAIYIIRIESLKHNLISQLFRIKKYVMDESCSQDIDTMMDWKIAEFILEK